MAKLALAATDETTFGGRFVRFVADRQTGDAAARQGGGDALAYRLMPGGFVLYFGHGRIAGIDYDESGQVVVRLDNYVPFATPVASEEEATFPRARWMLRLDDARAAQVFASGSRTLPEDGAGEAQNPIETRISIKRQVLRNWGERCAITGQRDGLDMVAIRPREAGGQLHVRNYLPMIPTAAHAWEHGVISVGPSGNIVVVENQLGADLLERMDRSGRLLLPSDPDLHPDPSDLAFHLYNVLDR